MTTKFYSKPVLNVSNVIGKMNLFNEEQAYANKGVLPNTIHPRFHETHRCLSQNSNYPKVRSGAYSSLN